MIVGNIKEVKMRAKNWKYQNQPTPQELKYLGSEKYDSEKISYIGRAKGAFQKLKKVLQSRKI